MDGPWAAVKRHGEGVLKWPVRSMSAITVGAGGSGADGGCGSDGHGGGGEGQSRQSLEARHGYFLGDRHGRREASGATVHHKVSAVSPVRCVEDQSGLTPAGRSIARTSWLG